MSHVTHMNESCHADELLTLEDLDPEYDPDGEFESECNFFFGCGGGIRDLPKRVGFFLSPSHLCSAVTFRNEPDSSWKEPYSAQQPYIC